MFNFKKKNYLKRLDFINSVNSDKIWSKSMTMNEIKELLVYLERELSKYDYAVDKNFIMNSRRNNLKQTIDELLQNKNVNIIESIHEALFAFWEFVGDEYPGNVNVNCRDLGLSIKKFSTMDSKYRKKGIICLQEKEAILELISIIKSYICEIR